VVVLADFENQQQYFDKQNIALSFYHNIACENRPSDEGLTVEM
jgi:hypothetical protein